ILRVPESLPFERVNRAARVIRDAGVSSIRVAPAAVEQPGASSSGMGLAVPLWCFRREGVAGNSFLRTVGQRMGRCGLKWGTRKGKCRPAALGWLRAAEGGCPTFLKAVFHLA